MSTTMMSSRPRRPLSRPEIVMAASSASRRMEKLLLVAGVQPNAASSRAAPAMASAQSASRAESMDIEAFDMVLDVQTRQSAYHARHGGLAIMRITPFLPKA